MAEFRCFDGCLWSIALLLFSVDGGVCGLFRFCRTGRIDAGLTIRVFPCDSRLLALGLPSRATDRLFCVCLVTRHTVEFVCEVR